MNTETHQQLRGAIEALNCQHLDIQKKELISMVESLDYGFSAGIGTPNHQRLSPRESEILNMILAGQRLKEIAATLNISVKTVTTHRSRLLRKLGLEDNLGLYRYGIRNGLISV